MGGTDMVNNPLGRTLKWPAGVERDTDGSRPMEGGTDGCGPGASNEVPPLFQGAPRDGAASGVLVQWGDEAAIDAFS